jgi:hypothetical protein
MNKHKVEYGQAIALFVARMEGKKLVTFTPSWIGLADISNIVYGEETVGDITYFTSQNEEETQQWIDSKRPYFGKNGKFIYKIKRLLRKWSNS